MILKPKYLDNFLSIFCCLFLRFLNAAFAFILDAEVWGRSSSHLHVYVTAKALGRVLEKLRSNNVSYNVLNDNLKKSFDLEISEVYRNEELSGSRSFADNPKWDRYWDLGTIYFFCYDLARKYPDKVKIVELGRSVENRPLVLVKILSGQATAKSIWLDGGFHGREWVGPAVITYIINEIVTKKIDRFSDTDFYILPVANPDGYAYSFTRGNRLWRKNKAQHQVNDEKCVGVDLNRNFPFNWESYPLCDSNFPGPNKLSERETKAITDYLTYKFSPAEKGVDPKKRVQGLISFHSYGEVVVIPFGFPNTPKPYYYGQIQSVAKKMTNAMNKLFNQTYINQTVYEFTNYEVGGSMIDWAVGYDILPFAIEMRPATVGDFSKGFSLPREEIVLAAKEALEAVFVLVEHIRSRDVFVWNN